MESDQLTYPPLNTLKSIADQIWIVDGPAIRFGPPLLRMPFSTRMTIIRIGGDLLIHSPTPLTPELKREVEGIGRPRWIIGPNRIHYWWIPDWAAAFPQASVYLAPRIKEQAKGRIAGETLPLDGDSGYPWDAELATLPVAGRYMTEVIFFHRASRTLILTDFIENFEQRKIGSALWRYLTKLGGVRDPDGSMPRDMRMSYAKPVVRAAVEKMIEWKPERIILAHGRWYESNGAAELRRAFRWVLKD